jgi:hypothetical protein
MKLISVGFLQTANSPDYRDEILKYFLKDREVVSIIMVQFGISFIEACEQIAKNSFNLPEAPEATDEEKVIIQKVSKEFLEKWIKDKESNFFVDEKGQKWVKADE